MSNQNYNIQVSVCMITYNHSQFIRKAIEAVLNQVTDFKYELVISDDCSPDDTSHVINNIINSHPKGSLIKYYRHEKNIGMNHNFFFATEKCSGKYIAFCEGDDYWIDDLKLQVQYDVLESNQDIALVHTDYNILNQKNGTISEPFNRNKNIPVNDVYFNLIQDNFIATLTVMVRNQVFKHTTEELKEIISQKLMLDYPYWLHIASKHKIAYLPVCTSTYRLLDNSASHSKSLIKNLKFLKDVFLIRKYFFENVKKITFKDALTVRKFFYAECYFYTVRNLKQRFYNKRI